MNATQSLLQQRPQIIQSQLQTLNPSLIWRPCAGNPYHQIGSNAKTVTVVISDDRYKELAASGIDIHQHIQTLPTQTIPGTNYQFKADLSAEFHRQNTITPEGAIASTTNPSKIKRFTTEFAQQGLAFETLNNITDQKPAALPEYGQDEYIITLNKGMEALEVMQNVTDKRFDNFFTITDDRSFHIAKPYSMTAAFYEAFNNAKNPLAKHGIQQEYSTIGLRTHEMREELPDAFALKQLQELAHQQLKNNGIIIPKYASRTACNHYNFAAHPNMPSLIASTTMHNYPLNDITEAQQLAHDNGQDIDMPDFVGAPIPADALDQNGVLTCEYQHAANTNKPPEPSQQNLAVVMHLLGKGPNCMPA